MNCLECRGACCEQLILPAPSPFGETADSFDFLAARGDVLKESVILDCRCPHLEPDGRCSCYDVRPRFCRDYKAGGPACLAAVRRRRTPEQLRRIKGEA